MGFSMEMNVYHYTRTLKIATKHIMAFLRQFKNSFSGWPCCFIFPITKPKNIENTTIPKAFTPLEEPENGLSWSPGWSAGLRCKFPPG